MTLHEAKEALKQGRSPAPGEEAAFELASLLMGPESDEAIVLECDCVPEEEYQDLIRRN
jgi:hypothetical protein